MAIKPICTEADYRATLARVEAIFLAQPGKPEFDELDTLTMTIEAYEAQHYAIPKPVEHEFNQTNTGPIIGYLALLGLFFCVCTLVGCHVPRTIHVTSYTQGKKLAAEYERYYTPRQRATCWLGPPPASCTRLRRTNPTKQAVILGQVDEILENGGLIPAPVALIKIDQFRTSADAAGRYVQVVSPGRHTVQAGWIGLLWSKAPPLQIAQGDSVRIDFQLMPDFRPLID